jgi:hypothetical protein
MAAVPVLTICRNALKGLSVLGSGETMKPADASDVLDALNLILDDWGANPSASYAEVFTTFATTPALNPHTIGPTGTWVLPVRPVKIDGLSSGGIAIPVHTDPGWWLQQSPLTSAPLMGAFYNPDVPNGSLYFSGLPSAATSVTLMTRTALAAVLLTASMNLAPGYQNALELTLMEAIVDLFHATLTPNQIARAGKARALIFSNNLRVPSLSVRGLGLPGMRGSGGSDVPSSGPTGGGSQWQPGWSQP